MVPFGTTGASSRRAILAYLLAIVGPALVLLYLGVDSVRRQHEAIVNLTRSNLQLSGARLAAEIEARTTRLAEACFRDEQLTQMPRELLDLDTLQSARQLRALLNQVQSRYPLVRHFFVVANNAVRFPLVETPLPLSLDQYVARQKAELAPQFVARFRQAENQEAQAPPGPALDSFRQCIEMQVPDALKALALARLARGSRKAGQTNACRDAYQTLLARYGDWNDLSHRPYALIAAQELGELWPAQEPSSRQSLRPIFRDLLQGRWELSAEQVDYFVSRLGEQVQELLPGRATSDYLSHFELARTLREGFRPPQTLNTNQTYTTALKRGAQDYQTFFAAHAAMSGAQTLIGFSVDLDWIERQLAPKVARQLELGETVQLTKRKPANAATSAEVPAALATFPSLFPFWQLSAAATPRASATARRDTLVFVGVVLVILGVLSLGVVLLLRDVSRETQLNRLRADFVSGVSHELKTPLTLIRLYGETLLYGEDFPDQERRNYYQIITRESERLTQLIDKVLDFSRLDRGQRHYHLHEGNLAAVVASTVEAYRQFLKRQGYSLETELATDVPPVRFDADAVSEAVLNLLDNAAKYSGPSKQIQVRLNARESSVLLEIQDNGVGILNDEQEKIFQQFYRGQSNAEKGGHGLGLFIVKHIMTAHDGRVEVESEVGKGSLFRLTFPTANIEHRTSNTEL